MLEQPPFEQAAAVKVMINIGALFDIPTGTYLKGAHGEHLLNGGLGATTGVCGIGNNFKTTVLNFMMLSAADKVQAVTNTSIVTYDTETNVHEDRLRRFTQRFQSFKFLDILREGIWRITDKTVYYANEWFDILKDYLKYKKANASKIEVTTPFMTRDKVTPLKILTPTFGVIDSFSEFETADVAKIQDENELGESGGNTIHMRQGLAKTRFLMELPTITGSAYHYMLMTAHIGKDIVMASGPMPVAPIKKLQYLKNGDKMKGVTDKFFFLLSNCWQAFNAMPLINQSTKGPEYPSDPDDNKVGDTDLNIVSLRQLRSKSGPSGIVLDIIVSQSEGVLPGLTEFHYIKGSDRFGISGTLQHYSLDLLPDVKISRTTVRSKLDSDPMLRRAMNITSELCQMHEHWRHLEEGVLCTPKELYDDIKALGYDWNQILSETRGYWSINNDKQPLKFLSTMDLLMMRLPEHLIPMVGPRYKPYWMNETASKSDSTKAVKPKKS